MDTVPNLSHPFIPGAWYRRKPEPPLDLPRLWRPLAQEHPDPNVRLRLEWVLHLRECRNVSETSRAFGVSRKALRKWRDRFALKGVDGLSDRSPAPLRRRGWGLGWEERERIRSLKKEFPEAAHVHSDNGSEFQGDFLTALPEGVVSWVSRPRTPTDNARLERLNRTVREECFADTLTPRTLAEMAEMLSAWEHTYNEVRPHAALGGLTPACYAETLAPPG